MGAYEKGETVDSANIKERFTKISMYRLSIPNAKCVSHECRKKLAAKYLYQELDFLVRVKTTPEIFISILCGLIKYKTDIMRECMWWNEDTNQLVKWNNGDQLSVIPENTYSRKWESSGGIKELRHKIMSSIEKKKFGCPQCGSMEFTGVSTNYMSGTVNKDGVLEFSSVEEELDFVECEDCGETTSVGRFKGWEIIDN